MLSGHVRLRVKGQWMAGDRRVCRGGWCKHGQLPLSSQQRLETYPYTRFRSARLFSDKMRPVSTLMEGGVDEVGARTSARVKVYSSVAESVAYSSIGRGSGVVISMSETAVTRMIR